MKKFMMLLLWFLLLGFPGGLSAVEPGPKVADLRLGMGIAEVEKVVRQNRGIFEKVPMKDYYRTYAMAYGFRAEIQLHFPGVYLRRIRPYIVSRSKEEHEGRIKEIQTRVLHQWKGKKMEGGKASSLEARPWVVRWKESGTTLTLREDLPNHPAALWGIAIEIVE